MAKPEGYPLPWCERLDIPYWQINVTMCAHAQGWREWQSGRGMTEIIPEIDRRLSGDA
jgi:hypothetical protein